MINFMSKFGSKAFIALKFIIREKFWEQIWEQGTHCFKFKDLFITRKPTNNIIWSINATIAMSLFQRNPT